MEIVDREYYEGLLADARLIQQHTSDVLEAATTEISRLRSIVRVNGLRWGHTHTEIDDLLNQQP